MRNPSRWVTVCLRRPLVQLIKAISTTILADVALRKGGPSLEHRSGGEKWGWSHQFRNKLYTYHDGPLFVTKYELSVTGAQKAGSQSLDSMAG